MLCRPLCIQSSSAQELIVTGLQSPHRGPKKATISSTPPPPCYRFLSKSNPIVAAFLFSCNPSEPENLRRRSSSHCLPNNLIP